MSQRGQWLTFRELSLVTDISWNKLRWLRDTGVLTDLGMILYQAPCHVRSRWWIWVPSVFCQNCLPFPPAKTDYPQRNASKT
jgi:hypothetical protein